MDWSSIFPGNATKNYQKKFRNGAHKKVPESAGLVGGSGPSFGQDLIFKLGPNHENLSKMGLESTVRHKNGAHESYGHFGPVRTGPG